MPIVFLSPSTQDWNPYVTGSGSEEYWMNRIVDAMEPYLQSNGIRYRRNDPDTSAGAAIREANSGYYDFYLALHSNAIGNGSAQTSARGIIAFYYPGSANSRRAAELFDRGQVPFQYQFHGQGTVSGELLETLGLGSIEKSILMVCLPRCMAAQLLKKLRRELRLGDANTGVAFTVLMTGGSGRFIRLLEALEPEHRAQDRERSEAAMTESGYTTVLTIVDRGFSEDVMHAARSAGATGGTVFNTRRLVNEETMKFWGMAVQQEREIVAILTDAEHKMAIMKAISDHCGIRTEARGVVLSLPVDQVIGLE